MTEPRDIMLRRLRMRSMRRGIKEMDLILDSFAAENLGEMSEADLGLYDALLSENDHDLYGWITGQSPAPAQYAPLIARIAATAQNMTRIQ